MIDSHCHLTSRDFDPDRDDVINRAVDAGVRFIVNPGTNLEDSRAAVELAERHPEVYACVGIHPHDAAKAGETDLREIEELSLHPKVVGIGEIGLDFHYDFSPRDVQERLFREQIAIARRRNLPVVIHTREAMELTEQIVAELYRGEPEGEGGGEMRYPAPKGVFHCYPGDVPTAWRLITMGFMISLPGVVTFKNPGNSRLVAGGIPVDQMLLETDSPYLAPVPFRGKRNEPMHIPLIARTIAEAQRLGVEDISRATDYAALKLFGIGALGKPQFTYTLKQSLYVNLTIRCNADCVFCDRKGDAIIKGINLKIDREPEPDDVIAEIGDPAKYNEIVFCGFGEPTIRMEAMKQVATWVKANGGKTRLNTNGHGNIINGRDIVPELAGIIDSVSVSLNATDPEEYGRLMRLDGPKFFAAMLDFTKRASGSIPRVSMTIVDLQGIDIAKAEAIARECGAEFQVRPFF
jgi:TatD DNase family protein